ncbi:MAG: hypothetical protein V1827_04290 [Candidatus Micrarchaeota archaeon]
MRRALLLLLSISAAFASQPFFTGEASAPDVEVINQVTFFMSIIVPLMLAMVAVAAAVYAAGQMLGAEARARATVWSHGLISAVGISALLIVVVYAVLPAFFSGDVGTVDFVAKIEQLANMASSFLMSVIFIGVVLAAAVYTAGMMLGGEARGRASSWSSALIAGVIFTAVLYLLMFQLLPMLSGLFGSVVNYYAGIMTTVVFFIAVFILITYLVAKILKVPEWEAYLNIEFGSLFNSFLMMLFVLGLFTFGSIVAMAYTNGQYQTPPQAAIAYMQTTVVDSALKATVDVYKIQACTSVLSTFTKRIGEAVLTQTYKVFPGLDTFVSITNVLTFSLLSLYSTAKAQVMLLYLVDAFVSPLILPAGIILRFFPPTRDAGAFLVAVAIGFYVVFPASYLLNAKIFDEVGMKPYNLPSERPVALITSICGPFKYGVAGYLFNPANFIFSSFPGGQVIGGVLSRVISEGLLNALSMAEFVPIMKHIGNLSLLTLFMPALSMMLTIAFINSLTKFIVTKV